jgi:hypothetical protein
VNTVADAVQVADGMESIAEQLTVLAGFCDEFVAARILRKTAEIAELTRKLRDRPKRFDSL